MNMMSHAGRRTQTTRVAAALAEDSCFSMCIYIYICIHIYTYIYIYVYIYDSSDASRARDHNYATRIYTPPPINVYSVYLT